MTNKETDAVVRRAELEIGQILKRLELETNKVTIQELRGRQNRISVEGAAQHFQHAMSLLAQRVQA
jgi:hypothetical protein